MNPIPLAEVRENLRCDEARVAPAEDELALGERVIGVDAATLRSSVTDDDIVDHAATLRQRVPHLPGLWGQRLGATVAVLRRQRFNGRCQRVATFQMPR